MTENQLKKLVRLQSAGEPVGIYSVCSANEYVIRAALAYGRAQRIPVLIEATANQVNQFGGYTGMTPADFADWVYTLADETGMPCGNVILGGDHLGPLVWRGEDAAAAMEKAETLVAQFVSAGFQKIHIDASMPLGTDLTDGAFSHELIARRSARLAVVCEKAWEKLGASVHPVYVVGSEVPVPGGAMEDELAVTGPEQFRRELELFFRCCHQVGVDLENIVGFVVQPGVEFTNDTVHPYDRAAAAELCRAKRDYPGIVFEGHSTDYQPVECLRQMVEDGIAILKVGPALTVRDVFWNVRPLPVLPQHPRGAAGGQRPDLLPGRAGDPPPAHLPVPSPADSAGAAGRAAPRGAGAAAGSDRGVLPGIPLRRRRNGEAWLPLTGRNSRAARPEEDLHTKVHRRHSVKGLGV